MNLRSFDLMLFVVFPRVARLDAPGVSHHIIIRGKDVIYNKGCHKIQVAARSLLCFWAVPKLGLTATELARRLGMTQSAVSNAVNRGEQIAKEGNYTLVE